MLSQRAINSESICNHCPASSPDGQAIRFTLSLRIALGLAVKGGFHGLSLNCRYGANCGNNKQSIDNFVPGAPNSFKLLILLYFLLKMTPEITIFRSQRSPKRSTK